MKNTLEKVDKQSVLSLVYNPPICTKSIDVRRQMMKIPEVSESLSRIEKYIFYASTKLQICDIDDATLVAKTGKLFRYIAMDVGYNIPQDTNDWAYICSRLMTVIKRYYSQLTLSDVKLAFELVATGELDKFLPKDSKGNPEKKHYQQFNVDYFARVLNAYRKKQEEVIAKAYDAVPNREREMRLEQKIWCHNYMENKKRMAFLQYKYTGKVDFGFCGEIFAYDWLLKIGFADPVAETEDERKQALNRFMRKHSEGFVNQYTAYHVRRKGIKSTEIDYIAYGVARHKEIIKAFDRMIEDELQVDNYLNYWK